MKRLYLVFICVFVALCAEAQCSDAVLFKAYLAEDMAVWDGYLHSADFNQLSAAEKARYVNYEYGYVPMAIKAKAPDAAQHLKAFEQHVHSLRGVLPEASVLGYESAVEVYKGLANKLKFIPCAVASSKKIEEAYQADSLNLIVLALKAKADSHAPKAFGGDAQRALSYFTRVQRSMEQKGDTISNWNYLNACLGIIQCEEKLGHLARAVSLSQQLLLRYPTYAYLRSTYLPALREQLRKQKR